MTRRPPSQRDLFGARQQHADRKRLVDRELSHDPSADTDKAYCVRKSWLHEPVFLPKSLTELHGGVFTFPERLDRQAARRG